MFFSRHVSILSPIALQVLEEANRMFGIGEASKQAPPTGITLSGKHVPEGTMIMVISVSHVTNLQIY